MYNRIKTVTLVSIIISLFVADLAQAWPRRRRGRTSYTSYGSSGSVRVAPKVDSDSASYRPLGVYYDYDLASAEDVAFGDQIRVFLDVRDQQVINSETPLVAEIELTDLSDHESTQVIFTPVTLSGDRENGTKLAVLDIGNQGREIPLVQPAKVYRMFVNLHRQSDEYGKDSVLGRVRTPYYVATSGESRVDQARRLIAMRSFKEFYYVEKGWNRRAQYPMDCHAFYVWATGSYTVGSQRGRTILGRLFGRVIPYRNGGHIPTLANEGGVHGDYVRKPGHTFMVLAYDPKLRQLWTMEANFNHTIEVAIRSVGSGWTVGHLVDQHIREDVIPVVEAADSLTHASETPDASSS